MKHLGSNSHDEVLRGGGDTSSPTAQAAGKTVSIKSAPPPQNCALRLGTPSVSACFSSSSFLPQRYKMHSTIFSVSTLHRYPTQFFF